MTSDLLTPRNPIAERLSRCGIDSVLLIDDAFDPFDPSEMQEVISDFWDIISRNSELRADLLSLTPELTNRVNIDKDVLDLLFRQGEQHQGLWQLCRETLFADTLSKRADLSPLKSLFEEFEIEVIPIGSNEKLPDKQCLLVFLDYSLGPDGTPVAVNNARERAEEIYRNSGDDCKPFIVLMSSKPNLAMVQSEFREQSGLLGGLFAFVDKTAFANREKFSCQLSTWALGMPARHAIQKFVEALDKSAKAAAIAFSKQVRCLGFEDYANIQHLSLQSDGHPLGDYMLWLYKSLFAYLLHNDEFVLREQRSLDSLSFGQFTPSQAAPSVDLADIYRCALTEPGVTGLSPHPRAGEGAANPYLRLGDMFFREKDGTKEVLVVLSAACDLAYAPGAAREFPADQYVLFEYGELQSIACIPKEAAICTELFPLDGTVYRILWSHRRAVWKEYQVVTQWLSDEKFQRQARLSVPYAIELQKSFANHISRIGMPVKPPLFLSADLEVIAEDKNGGCCVIETIVGGAQIVRSRSATKDIDEESFALTVECVNRIVESLGTVHDRLGQKRDHLESNLTPICSDMTSEDKATQKKVTGQHTGVLGMIDKVTSLMQSYEHWDLLIQGLHRLPPEGKHIDLGKSSVRFYRNAEAAFTTLYNFGKPFVLHVKVAYPAAATKGASELRTVPESSSDE